MQEAVKWDVSWALMVSFDRSTQNYITERGYDTIRATAFTKLHESCLVYGTFWYTLTCPTYGAVFCQKADHPHLFQPHPNSPANNLQNSQHTLFDVGV